MSKKHPALIVLKALLQGIVIEAEDCTLCMSDDNRFGFQLEQPSDKMYVSDWSLNWFIKFCENISEEKLIKIATQMALSEMKEK